MAIQKTNTGKEAPSKPSSPKNEQNPINTTIIIPTENVASNKVKVNNKSPNKQPSPPIKMSKVKKEKKEGLGGGGYATCSV